VKKYTAVQSDCRDLESDTSGVVASPTIWKTRLDDEDSAFDRYAGGNISGEITIPAVDVVDESPTREREATITTRSIVDYSSFTIV